MSYNVTREWDEYKRWLARKIDDVHFNNEHFACLLDALHNLPFIAYLPRDDDRIEDGKYLRDDYCSEERLPIYLFDYKPCMVLEMLVALAIRIDNEWIGDPGEPNPEPFFWEMLANLGLNRFDNRHFSEEKVGEILDIWIRREFEEDGTGSIFPLQYWVVDQKKLDIWKQMQAYLSENY